MEVGTATSPHINLRPAARRDLLEHSIISAETQASRQPYDF